MEKDTVFNVVCYSFITSVSRIWSLSLDCLLDKILIYSTKFCLMLILFCNLSYLNLYADQAQLCLTSVIGQEPKKTPKNTTILKT